MRTNFVFAILLLLATPALAEMGYYSGPSTLYPYDPVYCDKDRTVQTACYGVMIYTPKSAPLPADEQHCRMRDTTGEYSWEPRKIPVAEQKFLGQRVCYLDDRGKPRRNH